MPCNVRYCVMYLQSLIEARFRRGSLLAKKVPRELLKTDVAVATWHFMVASRVWL